MCYFAAQDRYIPVDMIGPSTYLNQWGESHDNGSSIENKSGTLGLMDYSFSTVTNEVNESTVGNYSKFEATSFSTEGNLSIPHYGINTNYKNSQVMAVLGKERVSDSNHAFAGFGGRFIAHEASVGSSSDLGFNGFNVSSSGTGQFGKVEAIADVTGWFDYQNWYGGEVDASIGVYTLAGDLSGNLSFFNGGLSISGTIGGTVGSAHIGTDSKVLYNTAQQRGAIKGVFHVGGLLGAKVGIDIEFDITKMFNNK